MLKFFNIIIFSLFIIATYAQDEYLESTITRNNAYSFKCYSIYNETDDNLVISPFSISTTMAMAYIGSEGNTQNAIANNMNFITQYGALVGFKQLIKRYQIYKNGEISLLIGNALWANNNIDLQKKFKNLLKVNFLAHIENLDFNSEADDVAKVINRWVKKSSNYNVLNIIKPEYFNKEDQLIFTNYLSLTGNWENPFNEQFTSKDDFYELDSTKVKVDFMNQTSYLKYNENENFQIVELPYAGRNISMIILLPKTESDLNYVENSLNPINFDFWTNELYIKLVNVSIPKFRVEFLQELSSVIGIDGAEIAFSNKANFSKISKSPIHISKIIQKTSFTVDENKNSNFTEQINTNEQFVKNKDTNVLNFKANRPFIFVVKDNVTKSILLLGKVNSPNFSNLSADFYTN